MRRGQLTRQQPVRYCRPCRHGERRPPRTLPAPAASCRRPASRVRPRRVPSWDAPQQLAGRRRGSEGVGAGGDCHGAAAPRTAPAVCLRTVPDLFTRVESRDGSTQRSHVQATTPRFWVTNPSATKHSRPAFGMDAAHAPSVPVTPGRLRRPGLPREYRVLMAAPDHHPPPPGMRGSQGGP